jgi:DNA polymerase I
MDLNINLSIDNEDTNNKKKARAKAAQKKHKEATKEPSWVEVWHGYEKNGKHKKGIWELSNTPPDVEKLKEVKQAIEQGIVSIGVPNSKFSKKKAMELFLELQEKLRVSRIQSLIDNKPENYHIIDEQDELDGIVEELQKEIEIAVDTETTGLDVYSDEIIGISFTLPSVDKNVYIPCGYVTGEKQLPRNYVLEKIRPVIENPKIKKFLHNAKYDHHMFLRHGVDLLGELHDTQVAQQILNENEISKALKNLINKYGEHLGIKQEAFTFEQLFGKNAKLAEVSILPSGIYACSDTLYTYKLGKWQEAFFKKMKGLANIFYNIEMPLLPIVTKMERNGFNLDVQFAQQYNEELKEQCAVLMKEIVGHLGDININSPDQMAKALYDDLGLEDISGSRKVDKPNLKKMKSKHPVIEKVLEYRDLFKLQSTYIDALPQRIAQSTGRLHGTFSQDKTDTGRFSSEQPNLQNLSKRARRMFVSVKNQTIMVGSDYSQIEPRLLSHLADDHELQEPYIKGEDLYLKLASKVFKKPIEELNDKSPERSMMKTGLLACMYGTSPYTLGEQLNIPIEEAAQFIKDFYKAYPKVKQWIEGIYETAKQQEYVESFQGRKRRFPNHKQEAILYDELKAKILKITGDTELPSNLWQEKSIPYPLKKQFQAVKGNVERVRRQAVNFMVQGGAAEIMKKAMIEVDAYLQESGIGRLIATVHDEILMELDWNVTKEQIAEIENRMKDAIQISVPMKVDTEFYEVWGDPISKQKFYDEVQ